MSALPLAMVLQLIGACAPTIAPSTMASVVRTESGFDPNTLHVNGPGGGDLHPTSKTDAIVQATDLIVVQRRSVDLGLGQVNSGNLAALGLTIGDALDPCKNLQASAKILAAGYVAAAQSQPDQQRALRAALSQYNTGDQARGIANGYVGRVERSAQYVVPAIAAMRGAADAAPGMAGQAAPVEPVRSEALAPAWDAFGQGASPSLSVFAALRSTPSEGRAAPPQTVAAAGGMASASGPVVLHAAE